MKQIRVRMYRLGGIGDCFLLSFPKAKGMAHMLIDCGVLKGTEDGASRMRATVADIVKTTKGRLDVLVVTHEHWDHVSGFVQAQAEFKQLTIGEVWLAWTEDPIDDDAKQLKAHKAKARRAVDAARKKLALSSMSAAKDKSDALERLSQFSGDFGATGKMSLASAMAWARDDASNSVRCFDPGAGPLEIPGVRGVRAFVLGPPKKVELLKRSDPSKRTPEVYHLADGMDAGFMTAMTTNGEVDTGRPFDASFEVSMKLAQGQRFFQDYSFKAPDWRNIDLEWLGAAERLALRLDEDTNNTSLALAFELVDSGKVLLFPGDAQVGNWLSWEDLSWTVKDQSGEKHQIASKDLLERTVLYKVGHHGSHNATLRDKGLELMKSRDLVTMIPVYETQARNQGKNGWNMPFPPLLTRLKEKTSGRVIRADEGVSATWPKRLRAKCRETDTYIDYMIDL